MRKTQGDCLFCKIASGEAKVPFVYEDEHVVAFDDISPKAAVHTLIVPKEHIENLNDEPSSELLSNVFGAVPAVAHIKGIDETGYRIIQNNGDDARQTVHHLHVHMQGGEQLPE
ncbi:MAG: HIT domain-containing protein [Actinomycetia bacterium]|nr:HIT domain-containing protein [Actinomycetes bacterium]